MQNFTSKNTSINSKKLPAIFHKVNFPAYATVLDYGCGKHNGLNRFFVESFGALYFGFDPYNLSSAENGETIERAMNGQADCVLLSNVLNVIDSEESRLWALIQCKQALKSTGKVFITVYEGNKTGEGKQTGSDSYQLNRKLKAYLPEVEKVFSSVTVKNNVIVAAI